MLSTAYAWMLAVYPLMPASSRLRRRRVSRDAMPRNGLIIGDV